MLYDRTVIEDQDGDGGNIHRHRLLRHAFPPIFFRRLRQWEYLPCATNNNLKLKRYTARENGVLPSQKKKSKLLKSPIMDLSE